MGREIFYLAPDNTMMAVAFDGAGASPTYRNAVKLFRGNDVVWGGITRTFDLSKDNQRFLKLRSDVRPDSLRLIVVQNWLDELKQRVPTR